MEIQSQNESHFDIITTGVESEEVEEVNDAYKDILEELGDNMPSLSLVIFPPAGVAAATEGEMEEVMPSCCPLLLLDYIYLHCCNK